jgi:hypothetical protein
MTRAIGRPGPCRHSCGKCRWQGDARRHADAWDMNGQPIPLVGALRAIVPAERRVVTWLGQRSPNSDSFWDRLSYPTSAWRPAPPLMRRTWSPQGFVKS